MKTFLEPLRRASAGDKDAFAELVRRFSGMAASVARQRLRDKGLAEDAVQEAFLSMWLNLPGLRAPESFPVWLRSIVANSCNRVLRRRPPGTLTADLEDIENLPDEGMDPVEHYARYQTREMVLAFLASLSDVYREAAVQRYLLGRSYEEISFALGVPVGTIKRRLHEVRDRLVRGMATRDTAALRVGYLPISDHLLPMVAHQRHDQGSFRVLLRKFLSWPELVKALVNERLDAAMIMASLAMVLHNRGTRLRWVLDGHHDGSALAVRRSMAHASGRDWTRHLAGATMGLPHALSTYSVILHTVMGLGRTGGPGTFRPRYVSPSRMNETLARRGMDGFFCAEPWAVMSEASGAGKVLLRSRELAPEHICCILVVRGDFAETHSELLDMYLRQVLAAAEFVGRHPDESARIQARYTGVDKDAAAYVLRKGLVSFRDIVPDRGRVETLMNLVQRAGIIDRPVDLQEFSPPCPV